MLIILIKYQTFDFLNLGFHFVDFQEQQNIIENLQSENLKTENLLLKDQIQSILERLTAANIP